MLDLLVWSVQQTTVHQPPPTMMMCSLTTTNVQGWCNQSLYFTGSGKVKFEQMYRA